jgi:hypothetical protein
MNNELYKQMDQTKKKKIILQTIFQQTKKISNNSVNRAPRFFFNESKNFLLLIYHEMFIDFQYSLFYSKCNTEKFRHDVQTE